MAKLTLIDSQKVPGRNGPPSTEVYQLWVENPAGIRAINYGDRIPQQVLPHDHGNRRGLNLEVPLSQSTLGPQNTPGGAVGSWLAGVPLFPQFTGVDFATNPKLVWAQRVDVVGGVKEIYVEIVVEYSGGAGASLALRATLRPLEEHGMEVGQGTAPSANVNQLLNGAARATRAQFAFTNLADFGPTSYDRAMMVEIWLVASPVASWRLNAVAVIPGTPDTGNPFGEPLEFKPPRVAIDLAAIATGKIVQTETLQQAHVVWNQVTQEVLGGTPGMNADGTPNINDPFRRVIWRRHRHTGRNYIDPDTKLRASDGAVLNYPFGEQVYHDELDDNGTNLLSSNPWKGMKLHPGALNTTVGWLNVEQRLELPIGLPELLLQANISPNTSNQISRLWWYAALYGLGGNLLNCAWVATNGAIDTSKSGAFIRTLVEPIDGYAWQQNSIRLANGLGLWTQKAAKNPLPSEVKTTQNLGRITKVMRLRYTPTQTGPVRLVNAWALEIGAEGSGTYDTSARLNSLKVWPAPGY